MSWQELKPRALEVLSQRFGFEGFRGVQEEAVRAALQGRDALILMPTGGGKSLCYALPAAVTGGLVLVVSPLIALMQDQVAALQAHGVKADYLSSTRTAAERRALLDQLTPTAAAAAAGSNGSSADRLALLYVTPELLATDSFQQRLRGVHSQWPGYIKLVAVDEAHCISQWGHDYRPTYRQLSKLRYVLKGVPCMALTATATPQVRDDILSSLQLSNPAVLASSFNRPNIHYTVLLLDVQLAPSSTAGRSTSSHNSIALSSGAAPSAGAGAAGAAGLSSGLADDVDSVDGTMSDDADHAGYAHLLQLLRPAGRAGSSNQQKAASQMPLQQQGQQAQQQQGQQQPGQQGQAARSRQWPGPIAIVYALKRATVDALSRRLRGEGLSAAAYHAALPAATRELVLQQWRAGQLQVVVASVAFGMGVDKGDIELVVHYNLPRSIEAFYQESGRAGRNGQPARSVLMYATRDRRRMDWILQQDANKKASCKKRKKETAAGAAAAAAAAAGTDQGPGEQQDPMVAAAALRAFGGVVDLCCTASCRRQKLLSYFGEKPPTAQQQRHQQQQQQQAVRCCDVCDNAVRAEALVQQLQQYEQQLIQQRFGSKGWGGAAGKKRKAGADAFGFGGYSEDDEDGSDIEDASSDGGPDEDGLEVAAAVAAAKKQAAAAGKRSTAAGGLSHAGTGSRGPAGSKGTAGGDTDAFLAAMMKAEQAHERRAAAGRGGGGDKLQQLMAAKGKCQQAPLTREARSLRRAKLAEAIRGNSSLAGCSNEAAEQLATAYEGLAAASCGADSNAHKARMLQLLSACRSAAGWLQLPDLQLLRGPALEAVLRQGVAEAMAAAQKSAGQGDKDDMASADGGKGAAVTAEACLNSLARLQVTTDALEVTGVAAAVKKLRKHSRNSIAQAATDVIAAWRKAVTEG